MDDLVPLREVRTVVTDIGYLPFGDFDASVFIEELVHVLSLACRPSQRGDNACTGNDEVGILHSLFHDA